MKKFLAIAAMIIIGTLGMWGEDAVAQTPLASCGSCGSNGWELYVGGTYTTFDHWYDGTYDPYKDLEVDSEQRPGHEFKISTLLEVPFKWRFISGGVVGVDYYSREHENFLTGYDWNEQGVRFTLGLRLKLGG